MDDLLGEDWQKPAKPTTSNNPPLNPSTFASTYNSYRASPTLTPTGTASPQSISRPSSTLNGSAKPQSSGDSFGNLLSLKSQKASTNNVSIQERQRQLLEEKRRQQEHQTSMWESLGSGRGTPEIRGPSPAISANAQEDEDDILAAFNRAAPVDKASHFPPPSSGVTSGRNTPAQTASTALPTTGNNFDEDDDDPFGLGSMPKRSNGHASGHHAPRTAGDDDDILGDLGKPVSERSKPPARPVPAVRMEENDDFVVGGKESSAEDQAVAELVDMGFPADNAKIALTESGGDVQNAVGWLLQQAHEESKQKARAEAEGRRQSPAGTNRSPPRRSRGEPGSAPSWMREENRSSSGVRRQDSRSPAQGDKDASQMAQEYGNKLFKGATSLWKASQKQMAKTMSDFQQDRSSSQPRWMQDSSTDDSRSNSQQRRDSERVRAPARREVDVTDEAAMLDAPRERPQKPTRPTASERSDTQSRQNVSRTEPVPHRPASDSKSTQPAHPIQDRRTTAKLSRQDVEDQSAQAYVSPARRKKATPKPEPPKEPEVDLFSPAPAKPTVSSGRTGLSTAAHRPAPSAPKPKPPARNIPSVSSASLSTSAGHRKAGGEAFKRGDYASAHEFYSKALSPLPATHPIAIIVYTNRALTGIKTGDAKSAVSDADEALKVVGDGQGVGESIDLGGGEGTKDMREFYGKALMRKAEALEHLEKWSDAAATWRLAVEAGIGGAVSLKGKDRCERAALPKPPPKPAPARKTAPPPAKSLGNSLNRPSLTTASSTEAVKKLRAANAAAEKADDEKFALTDQVEARLTAWKGGKADNLRALLQSLDGVLWEGAGWKKVGMSDLVLPNKVKIIYMKAIAKVHPDKIPQDATTEQRMISGAVFSTLNEAWDKFKKDNNL